MSGCRLGKCQNAPRGFPETDRRFHTPTRPRRLALDQRPSLPVNAVKLTRTQCKDVEVRDLAQVHQVSALDDAEQEQRRREPPHICLEQGLYLRRDAQKKLVDTEGQLPPRVAHQVFAPDRDARLRGAVPVRVVVQLVVLFVRVVIHAERLLLVHVRCTDARDCIAPI